MHDSGSPLHGLDESVALRSIVEGTAHPHRRPILSRRSSRVSRARSAPTALGHRVPPESRRLRALAFWLGGKWLAGFEQAIDGNAVRAGHRGTPPRPRARQRHRALPERRVRQRAMGVVSYLGVPLLHLDGSVLGHLAVLDLRPMPAEPRAEALIRIFAARATAELQRLRAEDALREREEKLARLVDSAIDANRRARRRAARHAGESRGREALRTAAVGTDFRRFLSAESGTRVGALAAELAARVEGDRSLWIPGDARGAARDGREFPRRATLSALRRAPPRLLHADSAQRERAARGRAPHPLAHRGGEYLREELAALGGGGDCSARARRSPPFAKPCSKSRPPTRRCSCSARREPAKSWSRARCTPRAAGTGRRWSR
jgi:hypothetical protein